MPTAQQIEKERFHKQMAMLTQRMDDAATKAHIQLSLKARKGKAQYAQLFVGRNTSETVPRRSFGVLQIAQGPNCAGGRTLLKTQRRKG